jgi:hypothetical protein
MIVSSLIGRLKYLKGETGKLYESGGKSRKDREIYKQGKNHVSVSPTCMDCDVELSSL